MSQLIGLQISGLCKHYDIAASLDQGTIQRHTVLCRMRLRLLPGH